MANCKHGFRKYSERAKAAGEVMRNYLLLAKSDLTVQEARDACTYCRAHLRGRRRTCRRDRSRRRRGRNGGRARRLYYYI